MANGSRSKSRGARPQPASSGPHDLSYSPDRSVGFIVRDAHRAFLRALASRIGRHGVTIGMWYFLRALWEEDGLTQRELSQRVRIMEPTAAAALENMERHGLIRRVRNASDRRKINIHLTAKGSHLKEVLLPYAAEVNRLALEGIDGDAAERLRAQLQRIIRNLDADTASA